MLVYVDGISDQLEASTAFRGIVQHETAQGFDFDLLALLPTVLATSFTLRVLEWYKVYLIHRTMSICTNSVPMRHR